jgi:hypothetical protein
MTRSILSGFTRAAATLAMLACNSGEPGSDPSTSPATGLAPAITTLSPNLLILFGTDTAFTVNGTGFAADAIVRVRGQDRPTIVVSSRELRASVRRSDVALVDSSDVIVVNPRAAKVSNSVRLFVGYAAPQLNSVTPTTVVLTSDSTRVAMNGPVVLTGSGFNVGAILRWTELATNQSHLIVVPSTSDTEIRTQVGASLLSNKAGRYRVAVSQPTPGGGVSQSIDVETLYSAPIVTGAVPAVLRRGIDTTLFLAGSNFTAVSTATWNGNSRAAKIQFVDNRLRLIVSLTPADVATPGTFTVAAVTPSPGGGTSSPLQVTVR